MEDALVKIHAMNQVFELDRPDQLHDHGPKRIEDFHRVLSDEVGEMLCANSKGPNYTKSEHSLIGEQGTDFVALADNLADIIVYVLSESVRWGIPIEKIFNAVMDSQESKLVNGKRLMAEDGSKFIKGPDYVAPEPILRQILAWHLSIEDERFGTEKNETGTNSEND